MKQFEEVELEVLQFHHSIDTLQASNEADVNGDYKPGGWEEDDDFGDAN